MIQVCVISYAAVCYQISQATSFLVFVYTVGVVQGVDSLVTPALKSIMSKAVDHEDQGILAYNSATLQLHIILAVVKHSPPSPPPPLPGALFSLVSAIQVLASVFGYVLYPTVYYHTISLEWDHAPGISFFVMAMFYIFSIPFIL